MWYTYFDPLWWLVIGIGAALGGIATLRVKSTFARYSQKGTSRGYTGAQVAAAILRDNYIHDVTIESVPGRLSDHYDPRSKVLRLSEPVYGSQSMAALGVAAHEVGHAIQHARGYVPLKFRSAWVPVASIGTNIGWLVIFLAFMLGGVSTAGGTIAAWVGVALFGTSTLFTLITLPVEFDASRRALVSLSEGGYVTAEELTGARKVLSAAAMTYVAAFVSSLLMLLSYALRLGLLGGSRND